MSKYQKNLKQYLSDLSARKPSPGGGSAAALSFCLGIALIEKAMNFSTDKTPALKKEILIARKLRNRVSLYIDKDGEIFGNFMKAKGKKRLYFLNQSNKLIESLGCAGIEGFCRVKKVESGIKKSIINDFYIGLDFIKISLGACVLNLEVNSRVLGQNNKHIQIFKHALKEMSI
jgi:formiminotetrahydrofolate cyclodeaminase